MMSQPRRAGPQGRLPQPIIEIPPAPTAYTIQSRDNYVEKTITGRVVSKIMSAFIALVLVFVFGVLATFAEVAAENYLEEKSRIIETRPDRNQYR